MKLDHLQLVVDEASELHRFFASFAGVRTSAVTDGYFEVHTEGSAISVFESAALARSTGVAIDAKDLAGTVLQFSVPDVDAVAGTIGAASPGVVGVTGPVQTPWGSRSAYVTHASGLVVELYSWN